MSIQYASFFDRPEWEAVRYRVLRKHGRKCMACGETSGPMHVDHIRPRSIYPELALDEANLQVLCKPCNFGKSNRYADDFRTRPAPGLVQAMEHKTWWQKALAHAVDAGCQPEVILLTDLRKQERTSEEDFGFEESVQSTFRIFDWEAKKNEGEKR